MAAFGALFFAANEWRQSQAVRRDTEAGQARLIVIESVARERGWAGDDLVATIRNHSSAPVVDIRVTRVGGPGALGYFPADRSSANFKIEPVYQAVLPPGDAIPPFRFSLFGFSGKFSWIRVTFTDANGRRWQRDGNDQPQRQLDNR
jgi:hypothetical protein